MLSFVSALRKFSGDKSGSVAIIFGFSVVVLFAVAGLAIDTARYYDLAAKMQSSLDAAVLAGAKLLDDENSTDSDIQQMAQTHYSADIASLGVKANSMTSVSVTVDRPADTVTASVRASVPTLFGRLLNLPALTMIDQSSKVVYAMTPLELSMVLDITGSMNNNNKIADMKVAAKDVIDTLYKGALSDSSVRIAVAPYSASVNAGGLAAKVTNVPSTTTCSQTWWFGTKCQTVAGVDADTCVIERTGLNAASDAAPVGADKLPNVPTTPYGNYVCPPATVIPLMGKSEVATIKGTIDGYVAAGATAGHIGTAWGWYLISPDWAGVLPAASAPKPYADKNVMKAMIIMTDGLFNTSYLTGSATAAATQMDESYQQFDTLCANIKAKQITIFTVGFDLSDPRALGELQNCASGGANFFDAKTGADLKKAFGEIANRLTSMRVSS